jgi:hypothetical protein
MNGARLRHGTGRASLGMCPSGDALALAIRELNRRLGLGHSRVALTRLVNIFPARGMPGPPVQDHQPGTVSSLSRLTTKIDYFPDTACLSGVYSTAYPDLTPVLLGIGGNPLLGAYLKR